MVRYLLIIILTTLSSVLSAQTLSVGFRMNVAVGWSVSSQQLDYHYFNGAGTTGLLSVKSVTMDMKDRPQFAYTPELFIKYQFKNRYFL